MLASAESSEKLLSQNYSVKILLWHVIFTHKKVVFPPIFFELQQNVNSNDNI